MTPSASIPKAQTERDAAMLVWVQEIAPYGIVTTDTGMRIQSWNEWLTTHSGMEARQVIGRDLFEIFPELKARRLDEHYLRALGGEVSVLSTALHRYLLPLPSPVREGGYAHMQQTARIAPLIANGSTLGTITIVEDVTHREAQAALLRTHAETLEAKVAERTAALHETIAQLESFSYTVAHDLRAPIRSLTGYCDILLTDFHEAIPDAARGMIQKLHRSSTRLDALTRDLLRFSKVSRQELELAVLSLDEMVGEIVAITPALQGGVVTIEAPLGEVWAQRMLLQQCLSNLFDNAVKFVHAGTSPRILVRSERGDAVAAGGSSPRRRQDRTMGRWPGADGFNAESGSASPWTTPRVRIYIIDNGVGIPTDAHDRIFGIFERLTGQPGVEGTGIGLAIVERATYRMGGRCGVDSEVGRGSRFWIELAAADGPKPVSLPTDAR